MVLVAVPASDSEDQLCLFVLYLKHCLLCFSISDRDTPAHTCGLNVCSHGSVRVAVKVSDSCANASSFINSSLHLKMSSPPFWNSAHQNNKFVHLSQGVAVGGGVLSVIVAAVGVAATVVPGHRGDASECLLAATERARIFCSSLLSVLATPAH